MRRQHEVAGARMHHDIAHRHRGEVAALVLRPALPAIHADPESELGAEEQQIRH